MNINNNLFSTDEYDTLNLNYITKIFNEPPFYFYLHINRPHSIDTISITTPKVDTFEELPKKINEIIKNNNLLKCYLSLDNDDELQIWFNITLYYSKDNIKAFKFTYIYKIKDIKLYL